MYTPEALLDLHERTHRSLRKLLDHCRLLNSDELHTQFEGFSYPTVQLQFHHEINAQNYWLGVLYDRIDIDDNAPDYLTIDTLEVFRLEVYNKTEAYLRSTATEDLNTIRKMMTWGNRELHLTPAHVILRTLTHLYHHQGEITVMCRLMGKGAKDQDFPVK